MDWRDVSHTPEGAWRCCAGDCQQPATTQVAVPTPTDDDPHATKPRMACDDHSPDLTPAP